MNGIALLFGVLFGALLVGSRVIHYNVIHESLLLHNAYLFLLMGSAMIVGLLVLWLLEKTGWKTLLNGPLRIRQLQIQRRHIFGGMLFGIGWAISGTCPAVSAAQLGTGMLTGLIVMLGLFAGTFLHDLVITSPKLLSGTDDVRKKTLRDVSRAKLK